MPEFQDLYQQALEVKLNEIERVAYALSLDMESWNMDGQMPPDPGYIRSRGMKFPKHPEIMQGKIRRMLRNNVYERKESEAALRMCRIRGKRLRASQKKTTKKKQTKTNKNKQNKTTQTHHDM